MENSMKLRSGKVIPQVRKTDAEKKNYLTGAMLDMMHLMPKGDPIGYDLSESGETEFFYNPERVTVAPVGRWNRPEPAVAEPEEEPLPELPMNDPITLESGNEIGRLNVRRAAQLGLYSGERLAAMHYETAEEPRAYYKKSDGTLVYLYDRRTASRLPLPCAKCGKGERYRHKLCRACYEEEMAVRRAEGDAHRAEHYHMQRERVLFFDLELTGIYDHDEILSISIVDATGKVIMDTLIRPTHNKRWKRTEKIHGITPDMVVDAPTLAEVTPRVKEIFADADNLIAYGVSTDYSHIKYIYDTEAEREALHRKTRCCANEFVRYAHEHCPDLMHMSLTDAMAHFEVAWDGVAHSSIADTIGCMKVWEKLFPNYYDN